MTKRTEAFGDPGATPRRSRRRMLTIQGWDEVPKFANEDEEAAFWTTHDLGQPLLDQMQAISLDGAGVLPPARTSMIPARTRPISIRLDDNLLSRLKVLAVRKKKGYQSLLKEFVVERVYEEEKREGMI